MRLAVHVAFVCGLLISCAGERDLFVALPDAEPNETVAVVVVVDVDGRMVRAEAFALDADPVFRQTTNDETTVYVGYFDGLAVNPGVLRVATEESCRTVTLESFTRVFSLRPGDAAQLESVASLPPSVVDPLFEASCPCAPLVRTEIVMQSPTVYDATRLDDRTALVVTSVGLESVSIDAGESEIVVSNGSLRSVFVAPDGARYVGHVGGGLFTVTSTGGLTPVLDAGDDTELRDLAGPADEPLELVMLHNSGFARVWDGTQLTTIVDDEKVANSNTIGNLISRDRGRAIIVQGEGSGLHLWDASMPAKVEFVEWDALILGPIADIAWFENFGGRISSRARLEFESADARQWTRVFSDHPLPAGLNVKVYVGYDGGFLGLGREGLVQYFAPDGRYCPYLEVGGRIDPKAAVELPDGVLVFGDQPEGLPARAMRLQSQ